MDGVFPVGKRYIIIVRVMDGVFPVDSESDGWCVFLQDGRSDKAIDKALELIGEWKAAFGSRSGYKAVNDVFGELEREGFFIPEPQVASAAFIKPPPEWVISDHCHMCRQEFNRLKGWFPVSHTPLFLSIIVDDSSPFQTTLSCVQHLSLSSFSLFLSVSFSLLSITAGTVARVCVPNAPQRGLHCQSLGSSSPPESVTSATRQWLRTRLPPTPSPRRRCLVEGLVVCLRSTSAALWPRSHRSPRLRRKR